MYNFEDQELKKQLGRQRTCLVIALLLVGFMAYTLLAQGNTLHEIKHLQHKLGGALGNGGDHRHNHLNNVPVAPKLEPATPPHKEQVHVNKPTDHTTTIVYKTNKQAQNEIH